MSDKVVNDDNLKAACALLVQDMAGQAASVSAEVVREIPRSFDEKMEKQLKKNRRQSRTKVFGLRRALVSAAMIVFALFTWLAFDSTARAHVVSWFKTVGEGVFHYSFEGGSVDGSLPVYRLGWIPEGGEVLEEKDRPEDGLYSIVVMYGDRNGFAFDYAKYDEGRVLSVDTLGNKTVQSVITIKSQKVEEYYTPATEDYVYVWMDDAENLYFSLWSNLDRDTNIRILREIGKK